MSRSIATNEKKKELKKEMGRLHILEKDIKETFVRSSGPGGQNINKVSTCVVLRHIPSGLQVKCQAARSQGANRFRARFLLVRKMEKQLHDRKLKEMRKREKIKRQNRKRPRYVKEEILKEKHKKSEKKQSRQKIRIQKINDYL